MCYMKMKPEYPLKLDNSVIEEEDIFGSYIQQNGILTMFIEKLLISKRNLDHYNSASLSTINA